MNKIFLIAAIALVTTFSKAQTVKILFDASKAEMAGNADWVIDADLHNISYSGGPATIGGGNEANPQKIPTPAQSGITAGTSETYWSGSLSAWGVDCVKRGYQVETLPYNGAITYGSSTNTQDLSHYKVFIVCEPNIVFTTAQKTALMNFIQNGGGLFMISDHDVSDRNGDGWDSPGIWNDFISTNSVHPNPFGFHFDLQNFSETSTNIITSPSDSLLHGPMGNVTEVQWSNGTSMTLNTSENATAKGVVFRTGYSHTGATGAMCTYARFGNGKVAAIGDSSPCDDGTGDPNDALYNGYFGDAAGNHQLLLMNITIWLAESNTVATGIPDVVNNISLNVYPNPSDNEFTVSCHTEIPATITVFDIAGREINCLPTKQIVGNMDLTANLAAGTYYIRLTTAKSSIVKKEIIIR